MKLLFITLGLLLLCSCESKPETDYEMRRNFSWSFYGVTGSYGRNSDGWQCGTFAPDPTGEPFLFVSFGFDNDGAYYDTPKEAIATIEYECSRHSTEKLRKL